MKTSITKTITVIFILFVFQSCSSTDKKQSIVEEKSISVASAVSSSGKTEISTVKDEELEQAAALLLLATLVNEMDNTSDENISKNTEVDYDGNDYDKGTQIINDHIECELGSQIVYE
jgi:uncharacterized membrane protein YcgQ (UPF0703/DUF1980 family)